jgi:hypothetical protein
MAAEYEPLGQLLVVGCSTCAQDGGEKTISSTPCKERELHYEWRVSQLLAGCRTVLSIPYQKRAKYWNCDITQMRAANEMATGSCVPGGL